MLQTVMRAKKYTLSSAIELFRFWSINYNIAFPILTINIGAFYEGIECHIIKIIHPLFTKDNKHRKLLKSTFGYLQLRVVPSCLGANAEELSN